MAGAASEPFLCVRSSDTAADLHPIGIGGQRSTSRLIISRTKFDHVSPGQAVGPISLGEPVGRSIGNEILDRTRAFVAQAAADNLLHAAIVQVNAGSKKCHSNSDMIGPIRFAVLLV